jgi:hypothetical protein
MDILTQKGQQTRRQEEKALTLFRETFPGFEFIETPKDTPADIDGIIVSNGKMVSCAEVKCRNMTMDVLVREFGKKWLVTADKIDRCVNIASSLGIDFRGFLYLVPEKILLIVPIWSYENGYTCRIDRETTSTQATVNGGTALRENAYIHLEKVTAIREV